MVPLAAAALGCYIRYNAKKLKKHKVNAEIFVVWPELSIAAIFNLLILISDTAAKPHPSPSRFVGLSSASVLALFGLWVISLVSGIPRKGKYRIAIWTYGFPHLVAFGILEVTLLLAKAG
jgi:hypothetical protein